MIIDKKESLRLIRPEPDPYLPFHQREIPPEKALSPVEAKRKSRYSGSKMPPRGAQWNRFSAYSTGVKSRWAISLGRNLRIEGALGRNG
jgi:hypothetical protein